MIFLIHSETETGTIDANLGASEYSYYFVLKEFRPVLEEFGLVVPVNDPANEVDVIWQNALSHGERSVFLTFSPPHRSFISENCPTIPVFAWEFDSLPTESWDEDPRHDWRTVLRRCKQAITHSAFAVETTKKAMGADYPVISCPAPVWDRFAPLYRPDLPATLVPKGETRITVRGRVIDTNDYDVIIYSPMSVYLHGDPGLPETAGDRDTVRQIALGGVIYTAVFCPTDGRKNAYDMVCGFCWAFRDVADATLVLKLTHRDCESSIIFLLREIARMAPLKCRIVIIDGFLPDESYGDLVRMSHYTVNTSHGEGQCLPLMEYMSAGKPAVAPYHSAMTDYIDDGNAFIVRTTLEPTLWPHDPRVAFRTMRHRIDFESLVDRYRESYKVAKEDPGRYARMAAAAHLSLRGHCSRDLLRENIRKFILPLMERGWQSPNPATDDRDIDQVVVRMA